MSIKRRYLIGKGELLAEQVDVPRGGGSSDGPYTMPAAQRYLRPRIKKASLVLDKLTPAAACPNDEGVVVFALHPKYLAKTAFPTELLDELGLRVIGSRPVVLTPRNTVATGQPEEIATAEMFIAGKRGNFRQFAERIAGWGEYDRGADDLVKIERLNAFRPADRIKGIIPSGVNVLLEVVLHAGKGSLGQSVLADFEEYARRLGANPDMTGRIDVNGLSFLPVESPTSQVLELAKFTFARYLREMPRLRVPSCGPALGSIPLPYHLPSARPLDPSIQVAVFDGGMPDLPELRQYVNRYDVPGLAEPADDLLQHGVAVTCALLFGPLDPTSSPPIPYAPVDHFRVLDKNTMKDPQKNYYPVAKRIFDVLKNRPPYDFVNLSIGPDHAMEDDDVDLWTILMDDAFSGGHTLTTAAAGNNGEDDNSLGYNRVQPPGDAVNVCAVGACDSQSFFWKRAVYSAWGPGRSPGRVRPECLGFGGSDNEPFYALDHRNCNQALACKGTSFAAPSVLRASIGVRATLGSVLSPLALRSLQIQKAEANGLDRREVGWGRALTNVEDLIECAPGSYHVIYQDRLEAKKFLRVPVPVPRELLGGKVTLSVTICIATETDPHHPVHYTRHGLEVRFRPDNEEVSGERKTADTRPLFGNKFGMTEVELRDDAQKWETSRHALDKIFGLELKHPVLDIHLIPRECGRECITSKGVPYAMIVSIHAPDRPNVCDEIIEQYRMVLVELRPRLEVPPIRV